MPFAALIVGVFIAAAGGVWAVRKLAVSRSWVAKPRADRWHAKPTALHGGVGFFFPFLVGCGFVYWRLKQAQPELYGTPAMMKLMGGYAGGAVIMFITGLLDDLYQFRPTSKLLLEVLATVVFMVSGGMGHLSDSPVFDAAITFLWFIGIVNAVNLLDNMDGASSGVVLIGSVGVCLVGYLTGLPQLPPSFYFGAVLVAAIMGFWLFNRPPATIFMGDSGSLFMGFAFAAITLPGPLNLSYGIATLDSSVHPMLIAATLAAIPILDTSLVTVTRLWRGQSPAVGGRDHSTHRLAQSGLGPNQTILVLYVLAAVCVLFALGMQRSPQLALLLFSVLVGGFALAAFYLACVAVETGEKRVLVWQQFANSLFYRAPLIKSVGDIPLIIFSFYAGYMVRFDFVIPPEHIQPMYIGMLVAVVCCLFANLILGIYRFSWRSASSADVVHYIGCGLLGTMLTVAGVAFLSRFESGHSRGAFVAFAIIYICGLVGVRFGFRFIDEVILKLRHLGSAADQKGVIIYGAGREGVLLHARATAIQAASEYRIAAFVDDRTSIQGTNVAGLPVLSPSDTAALMELNWGPKGGEIWISSDAISDQSAILLRDCIDSKLAVRRLRLEMELLVT